MTFPACKDSTSVQIDYRNSSFTVVRWTKKPTSFAAVGTFCPSNRNRIILIVKLLLGFVPQAVGQNNPIWFVAYSCARNGSSILRPCLNKLSRWPEIFLAVHPPNIQTWRVLTCVARYRHGSSHPKASHRNHLEISGRISFTISPGETKIPIQPTRFERVTFAFSGQRLGYVGMLPSFIDITRGQGARPMSSAWLLKRSQSAFKPSFNLQPSHLGYHLGQEDLAVFVRELWRSRCSARLEAAPVFGKVS